MTTQDNRLAEGSASAWKPSALQGISLIVRRELGTYLRSRSGFIIAALLLLLDGGFYTAFAMGSTARYSTDVLRDFFYATSGLGVAASILLSMRLIAEDRQSGALPLLTTSSLSDGQIVFAKFLSGLLFLAVILAVSVYMPLLIFVNGKVSLGHIFAGYLGVLCLGASATAIGTFGSAIASSQVMAVMVSGGIITVLWLQWLFARLIDGPLSDVIGYLSIWEKHFQPFMNGTISVRDLVYHLSLITFFLFLARTSLEGRRWRP